MVIGNWRLEMRKDEEGWNGNPADLCFAPRGRRDDWMRQLYVKEG
jgi:hypothetical protein